MSVEHRPDPNLSVPGRSGTAPDCEPQTAAHRRSPRRLNRGDPANRRGFRPGPTSWGLVGAGLSLVSPAGQVVTDQGIGYDLRALKQAAISVVDGDDP